MNKANGLKVQNHSNSTVIKINVKELNVPVIIKGYRPGYKKRINKSKDAYL